MLLEQFRPEVPLPMLLGIPELEVGRRTGGTAVSSGETQHEADDCRQRENRAKNPRHHAARPPGGRTLPGASRGGGLALGPSSRQRSMARTVWST